MKPGLAYELLPMLPTVGAEETITIDNLLITIILDFVIVAIKVNIILTNVVYVIVFPH